MLLFGFVLSQFVTGERKHVFDKPLPIYHKDLSQPVQVGDIAQGALANCYFLAVLGAIAHDRPQTIKGNLPEQNINEGVVTVKTYVPGYSMEVKVNTYFPGAEGKLFFAHPARGVIWPLIFEKVWAKVIGSYEKTSNGWPYDAFKALTQAPVKVYAVGKQTPSAIKTALLTARKQRWPTVVCSKEKEAVHLPSHHCFAVLDCDILEKQDTLVGVTLSNPWGFTMKEQPDKHDALQPHTGELRLSTSGFFEDISVIHIAKVEINYHVSSEKIEISEDRNLNGHKFVWKVYKFHKTTDEHFSVQVEWPQEKFLPHDCRKARPEFTVLVAKKGASEDSQFENVYMAQMESSSSSDARVDVTGSGEYWVYLHVEFPYSSSWIKYIVLNTYAAEVLTFQQPSETPAVAIRKMLNVNCEPESYEVDVKFADDTRHFRAKFEGERSDGTPQFKLGSGQVVFLNRKKVFADDGRYFPDATLQYDTNPGKLLWLVCHENCSPEGLDKIEKTSLGVHTKFTCKSKDALVSFFDRGRSSNEARISLVETMQEQSTSSEACGDLVDRFSKLASDVTTHEDSHFPQDRNSIGQGKCGNDVARGVMTRCDQLNKWAGIKDLLTTKQQKEGEARTCLAASNDYKEFGAESTDNSRGPRISVWNTCQENVLFHNLMWSSHEMKPVRSTMYFPQDFWNRGNDENLKATRCMHGSQDKGKCTMTNMCKNEAVFAMILDKTQAPPVRYSTYRIFLHAQSRLTFDCPPEFTATEQWMQFASSPTSGKATSQGVLIKSHKENKQECILMMDTKKCTVMNACHQTVKVSVLNKEMSIESLRPQRLTEGQPSNCGVKILRKYGGNIRENNWKQHLATCVKVYRNKKSFVLDKTDTICEVKRVCDDAPHLWGPKCEPQAVTEQTVCDYFMDKTVGKGIDPCGKA